MAMKAGQGQTLMDIAVIKCGSAEAAWDIAMCSGVGLTDGVEGVELNIPAQAKDPDTAAELTAAGAQPATDGTAQTCEYTAIGEARIGTTNRIA